MDTMRKRNNGLFKLLLVFLLIFSLLGTLGVGFLGYKYYKDPSWLINLTPNLQSSSNSSISKNFTSTTIYQPAGNIVDLVKKVSPAVTTVVIKVPSTSLFLNDGSDGSDVESGIGTGFFVSEDGLLITNEHVVCDSSNPSSISVVTSVNESYGVRSFVSDPSQDIAILKVDTKGKKVPYLKFANLESKVIVGEDVIAIGNPLGVNPGSVTKGIISGLGRNIQAQGTCKNQQIQRDYEGVIQTDAAINSGNSGGPLLDYSGEVVGVNSATSVGANNISYTIPFDRVVRLLDRYQKNNGKLTFPFVGVNYFMVDPNEAKSQGVPVGAMVRSVVKDGPADRAGLKRGDIITKINDKTIDFSLQATLNQFFEAGQKVQVEIYRPSSASLFGEQVNLDGKTLKFDLTLGER